MKAIRQQLNPISELDSDLLNTLFQNYSQGMAVFDKELRLTNINTAFQELLGYDAFALDEWHLSFLPFAQLADFKLLINKITTGDIEKMELETEFTPPHGSRRFLNIKVMATRENGQFKGGLLSLTDITNQRKVRLLLEDKVRELASKKSELKKMDGLNEELNRFAYIASHDLKEPLRMISNFGRLLERRNGKDIDDSGKEYLHFMIDGVQRMNTIIDDLLTYSRLNNGLESWHRIQPNTTLFLLQNNFQKQIDAAKATITIHELPEFIVMNRSKFQLLWECLISNAIKFRRPDVPLKIDISGKETISSWQFTVTDNGMGVEEEYFDQIFMLFKKLHPKNQIPGTGIGLALCKKITEQHGGSISIQSTINKGSTFTFTLVKPINELEN